MTIRGIALFSSGLLTMLAAGWVGFPAALYRTQPQPLDFNHKVHVEGSGMACTDCHSLREDGTFTGIPTTESCTTCHGAVLGETEVEKVFVEQYVEAEREVGWFVYSRQPANVRFAHSTHMEIAKLECADCHGSHGDTENLRPFQENRVSGYSRDIWGNSMSRVRRAPGQGMKMQDCESCHRKNGFVTGCLGCHK